MSLDLFVRQEDIAEGTRRWLLLKGGPSEIAIFFDLIGERDAPEPALLDAFVQAVLLHAMEARRDLRVRGRVTRQTLASLHELQEFWAVFHKKYRIIDILPDEVVEVQPSPGIGRAISAFSGGVDGIFTLLRHVKGSFGNARLPIRAALLVEHEPARPPGDRQKLVERVSPFLADIGIELKVLRTNVRAASRQQFNDTFAAQLSACLHQYAHAFDCAVLGSGGPYRSLVVPWGSSPMTDHLLSTPSMRFVHDGAAYSRTEKIEVIAKHPLAARTAQVCWTTLHDNCGTCPKCVRTRMNFLAAGLANPPCFSGELDLRSIDTIAIYDDDASFNELRMLLDHACAKGIEGPWVDRLRRRLRRHTRHKTFRSKRRRLRAWARERIRRLLPTGK